MSLELYHELKALYPPLTGGRQWDFAGPSGWTRDEERPLEEILLAQPGDVLWLWMRVRTRSGDDYGGWNRFGPVLAEREDVRPLRALALRESFWHYMWNDPYGIHTDDYSVMLLEIPKQAVPQALSALDATEPERLYWLAPAAPLAIARAKSGSMTAPLQR